MKTESPIGFFDSGVGGLSVYSKFKQILPDENTIYFGDLKNMPYGNKTKDELLKFARNILNFFKTQNVKAVVIACNTSSAVVYDTIKDEYDFKIYPIIQSCTNVIASYNISKIGVFATSATINSGAYSRELHKCRKDIEVFGIACPHWTSFVECGKIDTEDCHIDIKNKIKEITAYNPEKIILGCTHYPYLLKILTEFLPNDIFIDPAEIFVKFIKSDLENANLLNTHKTDKTTEKFYVSAYPEQFIENSKLFYPVKECKIL